MTLDTTASPTFSSFPRLAPELRIYIWSLATMEPRVVRIYAQKPELETDWLCSTPILAVMQTCRDARMYAPYTKAFITAGLPASSEPRYAWVNFEVDIVVMQTVGEDGPEEDPLAWLALNKTSTPLVQRFRFEARFPCEENIDDFVRYLGRKMTKFLSLGELQIAVPLGLADWYAKAAFNKADLSCSWCGPCDEDNVHLVDRRTGLWMTVGEARLLQHWDLGDGRRVREQEINNYDLYAEDYSESWVEQVNNVIHHRIIYY